MQSLLNYNFRHDTSAGWINYAGKMRQQPLSDKDFHSADLPSSHSSETPSPTHGQIPDPTLDGGSAAA